MKVEENLFSSDMSGSDSVPKKFKDDYDDFKSKIKDFTDTESDTEYYKDYMKEFNKLKKTNEDFTSWLDENIANTGNFSSICSTISKEKKSKKDTLKESLKNELDDISSLKETEESGKSLNKLIEKVKLGNPELEESLKSLNGIDMDELNKLINKINSFSDMFSGSKK
jgi:predicted RNase H-like nuclease (RuvC/YqgF family)